MCKCECSMNLQVYWQKEKGGKQISSISHKITENNSVCLFPALFWKGIGDGTHNTDGNTETSSPPPERRSGRPSSPFRLSSLVLASPPLWPSSVSPGASQALQHCSRSAISQLLEVSQCPHVASNIHLFPPSIISNNEWNITQPFILWEKKNRIY